MHPSLFQSIDIGTALVGVVMLALLITVAVLGLRSRRQRQQDVKAAALAVATPLESEKPHALDFGALMVALGEAEAAGQERRLPGLYLSLAEWRVQAGQTSIAEELLRKSIRGASTAGLKDTHAKARLALGDIAQAGGDLATACEHWQIARSLFRELRQTREHDAVDARMRRNGCPTDWVLTDF